MKENALCVLGRVEMRLRCLGVRCCVGEAKRFSFPLPTESSTLFCALFRCTVRRCARLCVRATPFSLSRSTLLWSKFLAISFNLTRQSRVTVFPALRTQLAYELLFTEREAKRKWEGRDKRTIIITIKNDRSAEHRWLRRPNALRLNARARFLSSSSSSFPSLFFKQMIDRLGHRLFIYYGFSNRFLCTM